MKFLILTVTTLNFVIFFPYNGSQELYSQTNQHFSANPPLCKQTASNPSYTPKTEEYLSTEDSNSYPSPFDRMEKMNGSPSEGNHLEMVQTDVYNFPPLDNDVLHSLFTDQNSIRFAYPKETIDNPKSNALPSAGIIHVIPAVSSFAPNSQIRHRRIRRPLSSKNGISSPMSVTYYQYEFDLSDTPHFDRDSEITQSLEHFSSTGTTKALFASDPAIDMQNSLEKLTALADESALVTLNEQFFPEAGTTTNAEAEQDVFFTDSTAPIEESILIPRKRFISLIGKETSALYTEIESEEEKDTILQEIEDIPFSHNLQHFEKDGFQDRSTTNSFSRFIAVPSTKITINEAEAEDDADFQETDDIPSSHNLQHFQLEYNNFEKDGFPDTDTTKSLSQFTVVPSTKITINGRDLIIPEEEYVDGLYVTNPTNKKIYFKPMATRVKINSLDESTKHNVETEGSTEVPTSSNSIHQIERMGYSRPLNIYYDVISKPISGAKEDPYMAWNTIRNKQLPSTMYSGNIIDLGDGYQAHTDITAKKNDRLANKRQTASNEGRNNIRVMTDAVNDNFYKDKDDSKIDLASIIATWPVKKYIVKSNDIETLKKNPNDLGKASSDHPKVSTDEETISVDDLAVPFNPSQGKSAVKEISLTTILVPQNYLPNKTTKTASEVAMTTDSHEAEDIFSSPQHESEASFKEDATLNYEVDLQRAESVKSEEEETFEDELIRDYIENSLANTQDSTNPDAYDTTTFRRIIKPRVDQPGLEVLENMVSKLPRRNFNPEVQRKMTATDGNRDSNSDESFSDNIYTVMEENGPNIYIFTPETMPSFMRRGSSIPMKDNTTPSKAKNHISKTNLMAILNQFNVTKMPPNATILSPDISALEFQEGNDHNSNLVPSVEEIRPTGLRFLLMPNQRVSKRPISLGHSDMSPDTLVMSDVSEPTKKHLASIDQNWEIIDELSAVKPFPQVSSVPQEDPMTFPKKVIRVTNLFASENGDISGKTDGMTLSANRALQKATYESRGINRAAELSSHRVQQSAISPSANGGATPGTEASSSFRNDKAVKEEKFYTSGDSIPVDLEELNIMKVTPFIPKPLVISAQQKGFGSSKTPFYPGSTMSTTKLTKVQARDPLLDNLEQPAINSYFKIYQLPRKRTFSPNDFIENSNSKPLTSKTVILVPENLINNFGLISDRSMTHYSEIKPMAWNIIESFDLINETDDQENEAIELQRDFHPLTLKSIVPSKTSANVIRNSINYDTGSSSTVKRKNIIAKVPHSQNSNIPLAEFGFISNDEFPLVDDSEDFSLPFFPVNTMDPREGTVMFEIDGNSEGESALSEEGEYKIFLALKKPAKPWLIPDPSTEYLETPGPLTSISWSNSPTVWP